MRHFAGEVPKIIGSLSGTDWDQRPGIGESPFLAGQFDLGAANHYTAVAIHQGPLL